LFRIWSVKPARAPFMDHSAPLSVSCQDPFYKWLMNLLDVPLTQQWPPKCSGLKLDPSSLHIS
jgi:hypothetical protein